jgi:hypothetical protein
MLKNFKEKDSCSLFHLKSMFSFAIVVSIFTFSLNAQQILPGQYGSGVSVEFYDGFQESSYMTFTPIKFKIDGIQIFGASKVILRPDGSILTFEDHRNDSIALTPKTAAAFNYVLLPDGEGVASYQWTEEACHCGSIEVRDNQGFIKNTFEAVHHQEIAPHLFAAVPFELFQKEKVYVYFGQNWITAEEFDNTKEYPYTIPGTEIVFNSNSLIKKSYLVFVDENNTLLKEFDLSLGYGFEDIDPLQHKTGDQTKFDFLHPNAYDLAIDINGDISDDAETPIIGLSLKGASSLVFINFITEERIARFPEQGFKKPDGPYDESEMILSGQHGFTFNGDITNTSFSINIYNNGGKNVPPAAEPLDIEINWGEDNGNGELFSYGVLWRYPDYGFLSNELGNTINFGDYQFTNKGRMDNEDPNNLTAKLEWRNRITREVIGRIFLGEYARETFNVLFSSQEDINQFGIENYIPSIRIEENNGNPLLILEGTPPFRLMDGTITSETEFPLPSTRAENLGVCQKYGDNNSWICSERLEQSDIDLIVGLKEKTIKPSINFFPNPIKPNQKLYFDSSVLIYNTSLLTMEGKEILLNTENNIPKIPSGIYVLRINTDKGFYHEKINVSE